MTRALVLVDLQNDFCPGGALPVPQGDRVIPIANLLQQSFELVTATQDWHPRDHLSFAANHLERAVGETVELAGQVQILWPVHCVQGTTGAALRDDLDTTRVAKIFHKGVDREIDSYSALYDNAHRRSTGLAEYLREAGIEEVWIAGLATDYCVRATALDAMAEGFRTIVVGDGCRGVELRPGDSERSLAELRAAGARVLNSRDAGELGRSGGRAAR